MRAAPPRPRARDRYRGYCLEIDEFSGQLPQLHSQPAPTDTLCTFDRRDACRTTIPKNRVAASFTCDSNETDVDTSDSQKEPSPMKRSDIVALAMIVVLVPGAGGHAAPVCAAGVHAAGCVGSNGAAVVRKPVTAATPKCASGPHVAGCAGPNGAAVVRKPAAGAACTWVNGRRVCR